MSIIVKILLFINHQISKYLMNKWGINSEINRSARLRKIKRGEVRVSDHAVMRYFERMEGYDIEAVYETIGRGVKSTDGISKQTMGDMVVVVDSGTVVTLYKAVNNSGNLIKGFDKLGVSK